MDPEVLTALGVRLRWTGDRVIVSAEWKPRHIGRPVTFELYENDDDVDPDMIIGTLEAASISAFKVSGEWYDWNSVANVKVWRREIEK